MVSIKPSVKSACFIAVTLMLYACSVSGPRRPPLPDTGPTMLDIYNGASHQSAQAGSSDDVVRSRMPLRPATEYDPGPVRMAAQEQIQRRFVRAPNPDMIMFVFPHLQAKHPVPGYTTLFPFYESTEYLLPGEVADTGYAR